MKRIALVLSLFGTAGFSQYRWDDWKLVRVDGSEKIYANHNPIPVTYAGHKAVALKLISSFECSHFAVTTHFLRWSDERWEIAFKSQIEFNWDATIRHQDVVDDSELSWKAYLPNNSELERERLGRAKVILNSDGEAKKP